MNLWDFIVKKVRVRFLKDVPEFVGMDLKTYGPFRKNEVSEIPEENANLFVKHGIAERI